MSPRYICLGLVGLMLIPMSGAYAWREVGAGRASAALAPAKARFAQTAGRIWFVAEELAGDLANGLAARRAELKQNFGGSQESLFSPTTPMEHVEEAEPADQS